MRFFIAVFLMVFSGVAFSDNSVLSPIFLEHSSYQSLNPEFKVLGIERKAAAFRIWLVAASETLNNLNSLRATTREIYLNIASNLPEEAEWEVLFYTSASTKNDKSAFHEANYLGLYMASEREFFMADGRTAKLEP